MKKLLFIFLTLISYSAFAQNFGSITEEETKYKSCPFDKDADAVIFLDKAVASHDGDRNLITKRRKKFKILRENGIDRGNVRIVYQSENDFEKLEEIEGYVYNTQGEGAFVKVHLDKKSIFRNKVNQYFSEMKIAFPHVRVGSIIEFEYTSVRKNYSLRNWHFQSDDPTLFSEFDVTILPGAFTCFVGG